MPTGSVVATAARCAVCGRQYKRSSHLRRHEATHTRSEQHQCPFCAKTFARRDVCRKHVTSCPQRTSLDEPPPARRGQRPRACDSCFKSKVSCDNAAPCSRCATRGLDCVYSRAVDETGAAPTISRAQERRAQTPVNFLLGLTDPKADSMVEVFVHESGGADEAAESLGQTEVASLLSFPETSSLNCDFFHWGLNQFQPGEFSDTLADAFMDHGIQFDPSCSISSSSDERLAAPIFEILGELSTFYNSLEAINQMPSGDYYFDVVTAQEVLTPENMRTHVAAFFRYTNFYYPMVHRATFDVEDTPSGLLLAIFLCGTLYRGENGRNYRGFYNIAEEYAFVQLGKVLETSVAKGGTGSRDLMAALQAAILIHVLQWLISCAASRRRNRSKRLPVLVSALRTLGYARLRHPEPNPEDEMDWERFINLETRIRIGSLIVQADWNQNGLYHSPCLTTIYELTGDMPCPKSLWEANDAAQFQSIIRTGGIEILHRPYSIRSCVEDMMRDDISTTHIASLRKLKIADLGLVLSAIIAVISSARFSCTLPALAPKALRAVARWQDLWKATVSKDGQQELESSGLAKHSNEMCWLARRLVEASAAGREDAAYFQGVAHDSLEELHSLVRELQGG